MKLNEHTKYICYSYLTIGSNILTGFILFPLILNKLGVESLGIFGLLYSTKAIIDIGIGWLSSSMTKNLLKYEYLKNKILTLSFLINSFYGLFGLFIFILYGYFAKYEYFNSFIFFAIYFLISCMIIPFYEIMTANLQQYQIAFYRFLLQFLFMIFSIIGFLIFNSLEVIFLILMLSSLITLLLLVGYYKTKFNYKFKFKRFKKQLLKHLIFKDGSKYFFNGISTILLLQLDVLLIDYLYGSKSAGIYLILWKIPNTLIMLGWRLSEPFQAVVAKDIKNNPILIKKQFYSLEKKILAAAFIAAIGYFILGNFVMEVWIGTENIPQIEFMYIVPTLLIIFSIMQRFYVTINYYTNGLNNITFLQSTELSLKIFFTIFFFQEFQELSPLIGWLLAYCFTFIFYRLNSLKVFNETY